MFTVRTVYEAVLTELNKKSAPSFSREEFSYFLNKVAMFLSNTGYTFYATNGRLSDDYRFLNAVRDARSSRYEPSGFVTLYNLGEADETINVAGDQRAYFTAGMDIWIDGIKRTIDGVTYSGDTRLDITSNAWDTDTPAGTSIDIADNGLAWIQETEIDGSTKIKFLIENDDYFHTLLCSVYIKGKTPSGADAYKRFVAKRLKEDNEGANYDNAFLKPKYNRPYYNVSNYLDYLLTKQTSRNAATIEIDLGIVPSAMSVEKIILEYLKLPEVITVTDDDIYGSGSDNSQILEFPETLRNTFISKVTESLLEYANNPRVQSLPKISQDIPPVPLELLRGTQQGNNSTQSQQ